MENRVYKVKDNVDFNVFGEIGYEIFVGTLIIYKVQVIDIDSEPVMIMKKNYYNNKDWQDVYYKAHKKDYNKIGLKIQNGEPKQDKNYEMLLTSWRIQINLADDKWLGFKPADPFFIATYYNADILDKYCGEEIKFLKEKDLIEEISVSDEN